MKTQFGKRFRVIATIKSTAVCFIDRAIWILGKGAYGLYYILGWRFIVFLGNTLYLLRFPKDTEKIRTIKSEYTNLFGHRFSDHILDGIAKKSMLHCYKRQVETFFFGALKKKHINRILKVEGLSNVDSALSKGKGVILLLSHLGSFLLPLPYFGFNGYKINQITGSPIRSSLLADRVWRWRKIEAQKLPITYIQSGSFLRSVFLSLRRNEMVAVAFDGRDGSKWEEIDFFEKRVFFSRGPFEIARKTGATIIPTFVIREKNDTHRMILESAFILADISDSKEAVRLDIINFAEKFAGYLERYPDHFGKILYNYRMQQIHQSANPFFNSPF